MKLVLDHFFIMTEPHAKIGDTLVSLGMEESFSRDHKGQGTSNRRFEFTNSMLELLWLRDSSEAQTGPGRNLKFSERVKLDSGSPFGLIFTRKDNTSVKMPFDGWNYQPDYFEPPMSFHVGVNSDNMQEPLCIYAPFVDPVNRNSEKGAFRSVSKVCIFVPVESLSETLLVSGKAEGLQIETGDEHLMEVTFNSHSGALSKDLRPELPLIIHW